MAQPGPDQLMPEREGADRIQLNLDHALGTGIGPQRNPAPVIGHHRALGRG
jgi:hypothetical protein